MTIPRPARGPRWLFTQTASYDILIAVFASVIGFSSAQNYYAQGRGRLALLSGLGTVGVVGFTLLKQGISLTAARAQTSTHELEGCLYTLRAVLAPEAGVRLRLAIHVPVGENFEQVTEYIGDTPKPGRVGRQFPINSGIIGKAYLEKDVFVGHRVNDDYEAYVQELISDWNYTEERARRLNPGAMEWMALPVYDADRQRVEAVLFLDVTQRGFFTAERQELILAGLGGIAVFVGKRYT
jgi:hypothetical protein